MAIANLRAHTIGIHCELEGYMTAVLWSAATFRIFALAPFFCLAKVTTWGICIVVRRPAGEVLP